jgi:hypothetical protein
VSDQMYMQLIFPHWKTRKQMTQSVYLLHLLGTINMFIGLTDCITLLVRYKTSLASTNQQILWHAALVILLQTSRTERFQCWSEYSDPGAGRLEPAHAWNVTTAGAFLANTY